MTTHVVTRLLLTLQTWLAQRLHRIACTLAVIAYPTAADPPPYPNREGAWARFAIQQHPVFDMPTWTIVSTRGGLVMGYVEWSPQWQAYRFRPDYAAVFNAGFLAEIYAFLRERGSRTGRFL